ncbi:MAG: hypothetical protein MHMPM18_001229 [Marteilia pararefringens]
MRRCSASLFSAAAAAKATIATLMIIDECFFDEQLSVEKLESERQTELAALKRLEAELSSVDKQLGVVDEQVRAARKECENYERQSARLATLNQECLENIDCSKRIRDRLRKRLVASKMDWESEAASRNETLNKYFAEKDELLDLSKLRINPKFERLKQIISSSITLNVNPSMQSEESGDSKEIPELINDSVPLPPKNDGVKEEKECSTSGFIDNSQYDEHFLLEEKESIKTEVFKRPNDNFRLASPIDQSPMPDYPTVAEDSEISYKNSSFQSSNTAQQLEDTEARPNDDFQLYLFGENDESANRCDVAPNDLSGEFDTFNLSFDSHLVGNNYDGAEKSKSGQSAANEDLGDSLNLF